MGARASRRCWACRRSAVSSRCQAAASSSVAASGASGCRATRGDTFTRIADVSVQCLTAHRDALLVCTDQALDGFALARLGLEGAAEGRLAPLLRLGEIREPAACPTCSATGITCPGWLPDIAQDLAIPPEEVGLTAADLPGDAGTGAPREAVVPFECGGPAPPESPGCAAAPAPLGAALLLFFAALGRRLAFRARNWRALDPNVPPR